MAVLTTDGALVAVADGRRVGGGPCALVQRRVGGQPIVHGTCVLQRYATEPTPLDAGAPHRLVLPDGRAVDVRILKHSLTSCGPEIVRFEGPGEL
ncbi:MAG TPA: hypothetical protein VFC93_02225 [Chloroflexota bacterium]|nr:hypothetical protein [Chloroflexota bacterium]